jgi:high-affinity nickel-transport protein
MITPLSIVALGFFLGMRHATDADHVVAVMTIVSRERSLRPAAWIGALWGVGHTMTILLVGVAIIVFNVAIPDRLGLTMELAVGVMLIVLGLTNVIGTARRHAHVQGHAHDPQQAEETSLDRLDRRFSRLWPYHLVRPLVVGIVHGLAGSAAVVLLVLATIRDTQWAVVYLLVFGLGTVVGMVILTMALAASFIYTSQQFLIANRRLQVATGILSLAFGCLMAYQIGQSGGW